MGVVGGGGGGQRDSVREPQCPPLPKIPAVGCVEEGGQRDSVEGSPVPTALPKCVWWGCGDADVCRLGNTVEKPWVGWRRDLWARG